MPVLAGCAGKNEAGGPTPSSSNGSCGGQKTLKASGSTAQENAMIRFVKAFERACPGQTTDYTANGSGAGIREFLDKKTDFGGSDSPMSPGEYADAQRRCGAPAWNLPVVFGPIAITYHINGVTSLILDGPTAAKIFNGTISSWNDPAITALNPTAQLPAEPIHVVFRSDDSGTSDNFQRYLDTAGSGAWGKGAGKQFRGGVGEGAIGNEGTAVVVKRAEGAISYNEWSFAREQKLDMARIITSAGPEPVEINSDSVARTIATAGIINKNNDLVLDTISFYRPSRPGSYPIVLATYEIVCSKYPDSEVGTAVRAFLQSTIGAGQDGLLDNGYVAIPDAFKARLSTAVSAIS
ncbi:phosphate ABC transporter substrate-binding protein PstS [Mycobacterium sp. TY815]|nr:phosphate ABC transporter substrate-binding protein PstS [Mycobacterium sp. TY815]MDP7701993.1 phosphate ABC transporter substrate-binding protein PstS [Mycobacterium sp. TY815]